MIVVSDVQDALGCLQLCGGQISGIQAAIHAFESEECEGRGVACCVIESFCCDASGTVKS